MRFVVCVEVVPDDMTGIVDPGRHSTPERSLIGPRVLNGSEGSGGVYKSAGSIAFIVVVTDDLAGSVDAFQGSSYCGRRVVNGRERAAIIYETVVSACIGPGADDPAALIPERKVLVAAGCSMVVKDPLSYRKP